MRKPRAALGRRRRAAAWTASLSRAKRLDVKHGTLRQARFGAAIAKLERGAARFRLAAAARPGRRGRSPRAGKQPDRAMDRAQRALQRTGLVARRDGAPPGPRFLPWQSGGGPFRHAVAVQTVRVTARAIPDAGAKRWRSARWPAEFSGSRSAGAVRLSPEFDELRSARRAWRVLEDDAGAADPA